MNWTQEQRDHMIELWDNGKRSYSQIAEIMGVTKNSVVGRMRREKRIRELPVEDQFAHRSRTNRIYVKRETRKVTSLASRAEYPIAKPAPVAVWTPDQGLWASIIDVTGCRWAVSFDEKAPGGHLFCNHATDEGKSYCPYHRQENVARDSKSLIRKTQRAAMIAYTRRAA